MGFIPRVTCRRCGRQYSGLRGRCPYCGTRRVKQSDRVPATSGSTDPGTGAGERAANNARWQLVFGGILLLAVILAVVVLVSISLNGSTDSGPVTTVPPVSNLPATPTPSPTPVPTPTPTVDSIDIYVNGAAATEFAMNPSATWGSETQVITLSIYPATTTDLSQYIEWTSSDESIITVTPNGTTCTLTVVGNGSSTITATLFGVSDSITVYGAGVN